MLSGLGRSGLPANQLHMQDVPYSRACQRRPRYDRLMHVCMGLRQGRGALPWAQRLSVQRTIWYDRRVNRPLSVQRMKRLTVHTVPFDCLRTVETMYEVICTLAQECMAGPATVRKVQKTRRAQVRCHCTRSQAGALRYYIPFSVCGLMHIRYSGAT